MEEVFDDLPDDPASFEGSTNEELEALCVERPDIVIQALQRCVAELRLVWKWGKSEGSRVKLLMDILHYDGQGNSSVIPAGTLGVISEVHWYAEFAVYWDGYEDAHTMYPDEIDLVKEEAIK